MEYSEFQENYEESQDESLVSDESSSAQRGKFEVGIICAYLLRGVIYRQDTATLWNCLKEQKNKVHDYLIKLGVKLVLDENEGYAYLRSLTDEELPDVECLPPRLMARRQLSFNVSFFLLLLRHKLIEFDSEANGDMRLVLSSSELVEMMKTFYQNKSNDVKLQNQIETTINKVVDLGFLKPLQNRKDRGEHHYEVMRIINAYFNAQNVADFKTKLEEYQNYLLEKK